MDENIKYYVVKQKALPEVLLKVAQANRLIETKGISVADATEQVGISRSSYYKYKEDILNLEGDKGGKSIIKSSDKIKYVDVCENTLFDIDNIDDFNNLLKRETVYEK